jgi:uncharacterized protein
MDLPFRTTRAAGLSRLQRLLPAAVVMMLSLCVQAGAQVQTPVPELHDYVTDQTNTLSESERVFLNARLKRFDDSTSTQVVVVILPTIGQNALEDVSLKIVEASKVGRKGKDNGVLLLVVKNDRLMRIEVGYGLEGVLTDALSAEIIRHEIAPRFRTGDYAGGITAGADAIMKATRNEYKADPKAENKGKPTGFPILLIVFIIFIVLSRLRRATRFFGGWGGFPPIGGGGFGGGLGGGGGFSGGGGSFGGGGSSGSW